jgi:beta-glucosidase
MTRLNLQAYRFSVSWSRVMPEGRGRVNAAGLDFYDRLIDGLLEAGIEPLCTLYHWDLPAALDDRGGWLNPDIADWFADYGQVLFDKFDGRVKDLGHDQRALGHRRRRLSARRPRPRPPLGL